MTTPRWYMVNKMGMATLCASKADAEKEAADAQSVWPHMGPHRAVQLVEAADVEALRAGYAAARLEIESLRARGVAPAGAQQPAPSAAVASKAVLAAIRAANMQLVRTGDDEFMLVTLKQATPQADTQAAPQQEPTCKENLQVQVWVIPNGAGSGQFSWEPQDERYWTKLTTQPAPQQEAQEKPHE